MDVHGADVESNQDDRVDEDAAYTKGNRRSKAGRLPSEITKAELQEHFHLSIDFAALNLKVGLTTLKKLCRQYNIKRWPFRKVQQVQRLVLMAEASTADQLQLYELLLDLDVPPNSRLWSHLGPEAARLVVHTLKSTDWDVVKSLVSKRLPLSGPKDEDDIIDDPAGPHMQCTGSHPPQQGSQSGSSKGSKGSPCRVPLRSGAAPEAITAPVVTLGSPPPGSDGWLQQLQQIKDGAELAILAARAGRVQPQMLAGIPEIAGAQPAGGTPASAADQAVSNFVAYLHSRPSPPPASLSAMAAAASATAAATAAPPPAGSGGAGGPPATAAPNGAAVEQLLQVLLAQQRASSAAGSQAWDVRGAGAGAALAPAAHPAAVHAPAPDMASLLHVLQQQQQAQAAAQLRAEDGAALSNMYALWERSRQGGPSWGAPRSTPPPAPAPTSAPLHPLLVNGQPVDTQAHLLPSAAPAANDYQQGAGAAAGALYSTATDPHAAARHTATALQSQQQQYQQQPLPAAGGGGGIVFPPWGEAAVQQQSQRDLWRSLSEGPASGLQSSQGALQLLERLHALKAAASPAAGAGFTAAGGSGRPGSLGSSSLPGGSFARPGSWPGGLVGLGLDATLRCGALGGAGGACMQPSSGSVTSLASTMSAVRQQLDRAAFEREQVPWVVLGERPPNGEAGAGLGPARDMQQFLQARTGGSPTGQASPRPLACSASQQGGAGGVAAMSDTTLALQRQLQQVQQQLGAARAAPGLRTTHTPKAAEAGGGEGLRLEAEQAVQLAALLAQRLP